MHVYQVGLLFLVILGQTLAQAKFRYHPNGFMVESQNFTMAPFLNTSAESLCAAFAIQQGYQAFRLSNGFCELGMVVYEEPPSNTSFALGFGIYTAAEPGKPEIPGVTGTNGVYEPQHLVIF